jgi:hypothetical protein
MVREFLVKWKDLLVEDATWENEQVLQLPGSKLLEDKQIWAGDYNVPFPLGSRNTVVVYPFFP